MTQAQLIAAMLEIGHGTVQAYWGDLRHDAKLIADLGADSSLLWAPRKSGSFVVLLLREGKANTRAQEIARAMRQTEGGLQWYHLRITDTDDCTIKAVDDHDMGMTVLATAWKAQDNPTNTVAELHM